MQRLNINSSEAEFGPAFYKDGIIFSSSRETKNNNKGTHDWTGKKFYSLFYSPGKGIEFSAPVVFLEGVQNKYNNSSLCFNKAGTEMVLTRNNLEKKSRSEDDDGDVVLKLKLFFSTLSNGQWSSVVPFQYNSDNYSCTHPALIADGNKLFFSSDMPGTIGGMDLWVCDKTNAGWSTPKNLGSSIITLGNEVFPTIATDGKLYFSSNGHEGIGGLDLYSTTDSAGSYAEPFNLGAPFNSSDNDFGLIYDSTMTTGYFSSNRNQQGLNDDIFSIQKFSIKLKGIVSDKRTNEVLAATNIRIIEDNQEPNTSRTGDDGYFISQLRPNKNYMIISERENY